MKSENRSAYERAYAMVTSDDQGRICRDIPDSACRDQPENFVKHVIALAATKTGDGLADAKLILAWIMTTLGAPLGLIGLLVPIREAGALLPQLFISASIRRQPLRKYLWAAGSAVQGLCVIGIAVAALVLEPLSAAYALIALLAVFSVARSVCSVSHKDVIGKTVSKSTRGTATGTAGTISACLILVFGLLLATGVLQRSLTTVSIALIIAGVLWLLSAAVFATLAEVAGATAGGGNAFTIALQQLSLLKTDKPLRQFIVVRGLLTATALAPPWLLALGGGASSVGLGQLGAFVVASAAAALVSSYVWGRMADFSSRRVLLIAATVAAVILSIAAALGFYGIAAGTGPLVLPPMLFVLMIAYQGVRLGRAVHVVDMATADTRAAYTALSNTVLGILLLVTSSLGLIAQHFGVPTLLALFAAMCAAAAVAALSLDEVQTVTSDEASQDPSPG